MLLSLGGCITSLPPLRSLGYLPGGWGRGRGRNEGKQGNLGSMEDGAGTIQKPVKGRALECKKMRGEIT